jgi:hypothetical protein
MKPAFPALLIACIFITIAPVHAQNGGEDLQIKVLVTPEPERSQVVYGEIYVLDVKLTNHNLNIKKDEVVDPAEPHFRFSGNLILDVSFTVSKEVHYRLMGGLIRESYVLEQWGETFDVVLPKVGDSSSRPFTYRFEIGYGGENADLDDWVTFEMGVRVHVEEYREIAGVRKYYLGELLDEAHVEFYGISDEKVGYAIDAANTLYKELTDARDAVSSIEAYLGEELDIDMTGYYATYNSMVDYIEQGDYVSAMDVFYGYEQGWKDDVIEALKLRVGGLKHTEQLVEGLSRQFSELAIEYQTLLTAYENLTASHGAEVERMNAELASVRSTNRLYLFSMIAAVVVFVLIIARVVRRGGLGLRSSPAPQPSSAF